MTKFELKTHFNLESARFLPHLPEGHPCRRMHGHSFKITVSIHGPLDPKIGWVMDYNDINLKLKPVFKELDHCVLNEISGLENPTSENLCAWIYHNTKKLIPEIVQISVSETPDTACSFPIL
jgi:6-pyruvoyltetrahydropterin/6-carboxytetrahydropterin synthase